MKRFKRTAAMLAAVMVMSSLPVQAVFADEIEETDPSEPAVEETVAEDEEPVDEDESSDEVSEESTEEADGEVIVEEEEVIIDEETEEDVVDPSEEMEVVEEAETFEAEEAGFIPVNETNFPDENFRNYIYYDLNIGYELTQSEIDSITSMDLGPYYEEYELSGVTYKTERGREITNLKGIEYFTALTDLILTCNNLGTIDISALTNLQSLKCNGSGLTALDVSNNRALRYLNFSNDGE